MENWSSSNLSEEAKKNSKNEKMENWGSSNLSEEAKKNTPLFNFRL
jgi:hypothetical protein